MIAAGIIVLSTPLFVIAYFQRAPEEARALHFSLLPPAKATAIGPPIISPDGSYVVFIAVVEGRKLLWVRSLGSDVNQPLTDTEGAVYPFWSPTGESIGFFAQGKLKKVTLSGGMPVTLCDAPDPKGGAWSRDGVILFTPNLGMGVHRVSDAGGSVSVVTLPDNAHGVRGHNFPYFLPDGQRFLYFVSGSQQEETGIYLASLDGERKPFPWLRTQFNEQNGRFSPDSKWIAYTSDESGSSEVYVQAFPTRGGKWQISTRGGEYPRWRRDGKEMFYLAADGKIMSVEVRAGTSFTAGAPQILFDLRSIKGGDFYGGGFYGVTGDGQRFLVMTGSEENAVMPFTVVLNWTAGLKR